MVSGDFSKYNQAVLSESQRQEIEQAKSTVSEQKGILTEEETKFRKSLRQASLSGKYSPEAVLAAKKQLRQQKSQLMTSEQQILKAEAQINAPLSQIKTPEQLEAQGYKKRVSGSTTTYYKEDSYSYKTSSGKRKTKEFIEEEYTFVNGKPQRIVKRDDYREGDRRRVGETEIIEFSKKGTVKSYKEYRKGERREVETYDEFGRLTSETKYNREGQREERQRFNYNQDGTISVKTRDYAAERKAQEKAAAKAAKEPELVNITATLSGVGTSKETEVIKTTKGGVTTISTTTRTRETPTKKISSTKTLTATKTPIVQTEIKQPTFKELGLTTGVNQGTSTQNIPTINIKSPKQIKFEQDISQSVQSMEFQTPEAVRSVQTQTSTPEQIKALTDVKATAITGREVVFGFESPKADQVNLNPARILTAPYQAGAKAGSYLADVVKGDRSIYQDTKKVVSTVVSDPLGTGKNIVVGTVEKVATDPFGFVGETLALEGAARIGGGAVSAAKKSTAKIEPIEFSSRSVGVETAASRQGLGIEMIETTGKVRVETGFFKKKTEVVDVQATGIINKETRAMGTPEPDVVIKTEKAVSTEITPARVLEGEITVSAKGKSKTVIVEGLQQESKQIIRVGKEDFLSETVRVGKLDSENIFKTTTQNIETGDLSITLSKQPKSKGTTLPTQEAFAEATISQTDTFLKPKDFEVAPEKIIDVEATTPSLTIESFGSKKEITRLREGELDQRIKISKDIDEIFVQKPQKTTPTSKIERDFGQVGQTQVFEQKAVQESTVSDIAKIDKNPLDDFDQTFKTETKFQTTQVPISESLIRDVLFETPKTSIRPVFSFGLVSGQTQTPEFKFDQGIKFDQGKIQGPETKIGFEEIIKQDIKIEQSFGPATSFKQDTSQTQKQIQEQVLQEITPTPTPTPIPKPEIPVDPFKFKFGFAQEKTKQSKDFSFDKFKGDRKYISSLGGALTGQISKSPTQDITGLKFRAILLSNGRKLK